MEYIDKKAKEILKDVENRDEHRRAMHLRGYEKDMVLEAIKLALTITLVVRQSEQLVCPCCKSTDIDIRHKEQSFKCNDCKEGWAN